LCVVVANTYTDDEGETQIAYVQQETSVKINETLEWWEWILFAPFLPFAIFGAMVFGMGWVGPLIIVFGPIMLVIGAVNWLLNLFGIEL